MSENTGRIIRENLNMLVKNLLTACESLGLKEEANILREYMDILRSLEVLVVGELMKRLTIGESGAGSIGVWLNMPNGRVLVEEIELSGDKLDAIRLKVETHLLSILPHIIKRVSEKMPVKP